MKSFWGIMRIMIHVCGSRTKFPRMLVSIMLIDCFCLKLHRLVSNYRINQYTSSSSCNIDADHCCVSPMNFRDERKLIVCRVVYLNLLSGSRRTLWQFVSNGPIPSSHIRRGGLIRMPGSRPRASLKAYAASHSAVTSLSPSIISTLTDVVVIFGQYRSHENARLIFTQRDRLHSK